MNIPPRVGSGMAPGVMPGCPEQSLLPESGQELVSQVQGSDAGGHSLVL